MITTLWSGLSVGSIYALVAICYNIPLLQTGVFNFAQGELVVLGCFLAWELQVRYGLPVWLAFIICLLVGAAVGLAEELFAIRLVRGDRSHALLVTTVGAAAVIEGTTLVIWGVDPKNVPFAGGDEALTVLGGRVQPVDLALISAAVTLAVAFHLVSTRTGWGLSGRAVTSDREAAALRGINIRRLRASAFAAAGAIGVVSGLLVAPKAGVNQSLGAGFTLIGFVALALGGFGSFLGAATGGLVVGVLEAFTSRYLGVNYPPLILFGVLLLVLLARPSGLFGRKGLRAV